MEEYQNLFDKLVALLPQLSDQVLEESFMNGLFPRIKAEGECWEPVGLTSMMKIAQLVENRELTRNEAGLSVNTVCKAQSQTTIINKIISTVTKENSNTNETLSMRKITLRGVSTTTNKREGPSKRLSNDEFQARRDKDLCFRCDERYSVEHK